MEIQIEEPDRFSLLGHILKAALERRLAEPSEAAGVAGMTGEVFIQAGGMTACLAMDRKGWTIRSSPVGKPAAGIRGTLSALAGAAAGKGLVGSVLRRRLRPSGNIFLLFRLLKLMKGSR